MELKSKIEYAADKAQSTLDEIKSGCVESDSMSLAEFSNYMFNLGVRTLAEQILAEIKERGGVL